MFSVIYRHACKQKSLAPPFGRLRAGRCENPPADIERERTVRERVDEIARAEQAALGVPPPQQGFDTADGAVRKPDLGLIMELELAIGERIPQLRIEHAPRLRMGA